MGRFLVRKKERTECCHPVDFLFADSDFIHSLYNVNVNAVGKDLLALYCVYLELCKRRNGKSTATLFLMLENIAQYVFLI